MSTKKKKAGRRAGAGYYNQQVPISMTQKMRDQIEESFEENLPLAEKVRRLIREALDMRGVQ